MLQVNVLEPHPHIPVLATSGLDDDIKIWVPTCEEDPLLPNLEQVCKILILEFFSFLVVSDRKKWYSYVLVPS